MVVERRGVAPLALVCVVVLLASAGCVASPVAEPKSSSKALARPQAVQIGMPIVLAVREQHLTEAIVNDMARPFLQHAKVEGVESAGLLLACPQLQLDQDGTGLSVDYGWRFDPPVLSLLWFRTSTTSLAVYQRKNVHDPEGGMRPGPYEYIGSVGLEDQARWWYPVRYPGLRLPLEVLAEVDYRRHPRNQEQIRLLIMVGGSAATNMASANVLAPIWRPY